MNAVTVPVLPTLSAGLFAQAEDRVNAWRGGCLNAITRAEAAVTECLLAMSEVGEGAKIPLPLLVGQRYAALRGAVSDGGAFAKEGAGLLEMLEEFEQYDALRISLCHGVGRVSLDRRGQWTLLLEVVSFKARRASRSVYPVREGVGEDLRKELARRSHRLCSRLASLKASLGTQSAS